jgi:ribosomal protein S18 acetylase RimI-like enzyme
LLTKTSTETCITAHYLFARDLLVRTLEAHPENEIIEPLDHDPAPLPYDTDASGHACNSTDVQRSWPHHAHLLYHDELSLMEIASMPIFRPARADELHRAQELAVLSINDLTQHHGFGPMATVRSPDFQSFSLKDDPDGLWVAEADGDIVGFALSWVCGDLWFLAELFVAPGHQGHGVGNELLARTLAHATKAGATNKSLITFTFNVVSQGLYIRHGLCPRLPIYLFSVARDALMPRLKGEKLRSTPIEPTASHLETLSELDVSNLGISREKHHRYLLSDGTMKGVLLHDRGECIGYAYVSATGHVGPLAVAQARWMNVAFTTALNLAAAGGTAQVSAFLPGVSEAIGIAVEHRMRITFPMVLLSTRDFGDWTRYLPRNPGFM